MSQDKEGPWKKHLQSGRRGAVSVTWGDIQLNTSICPLGTFDPHNRINSRFMASYSVEPTGSYPPTTSIIVMTPTLSVKSMAPCSGSPGPFDAANENGQWDRSSFIPQSPINPNPSRISKSSQRNEIKLTAAKLLSAGFRFRKAYHKIKRKQAVTVFCCKNMAWSHSNRHKKK